MTETINPAIRDRVEDQIEDMAPEDIERFARLESDMYEGVTFWEEDELSGATKHHGKFYPVVAYRSQYEASSAYYTVTCQEAPHDSLLQALTHAIIIRDTK